MYKCIVLDFGDPVPIDFELGDLLAFLQQLPRNQGDLIVGKISGGGREMISIILLCYTYPKKCILSVPLFQQKIISINSH